MVSSTNNNGVQSPQVFVGAIGGMYLFRVSNVGLKASS
jgi:hypothetical protein